jgi:hypothetical protein
MAAVYSTAFTDTARTKITNLLNSLKTVLASGYDPTFTYIYDTHGAAALQLNALTIELTSMETEEIGSSAGAGPIARYLMKFSIRCHVDYEYEYLDNHKICRLLNSVNNYLRENYSLGDCYWIIGIEDFRFNEHFSESQTIGGQMTVIVWFAIDHP